MIEPRGKGEKCSDAVTPQKGTKGIPDNQSAVLSTENIKYQSWVALPMHIPSIFLHHSTHFASLSIETSSASILPVNFFIYFMSLCKCRRYFLTILFKKHSGQFLYLVLWFVFRPLCPHTQQDSSNHGPTKYSFCN